MAVKPSTLPVWNSGAANRVTPSGGKQAQGFTLNEQPSSSFQNWYQNLVYQWCQYLDAPVGVTTTPAMTFTAGTGVASVAGLFLAGDNNSIPLVSTAGGVSGGSLSGFQFGFPGAAACILTGVGGLPAIIAANVAVGPGLWGTTANPGSVGVYGTGVTGASGGLFAGNGQNIATLLADVTSVAPGAGMAAGALGSTVAAFFKQYGSTRGTINLAAQTSPSAPTTGDVWIDSADNLLAYYNGTSKLKPETAVVKVHAAQSSLVSNTAASITFTNVALVVPAGSVKIGTRIECDFVAECKWTATPTFVASIAIASLGLTMCNFINGTAAGGGTTGRRWAGRLLIEFTSLTQARVSFVRFPNNQGDAFTDLSNLANLQWATIGGFTSGGGYTIDFQGQMGTANASNTMQILHASWRLFG